LERIFKEFCFKNDSIYSLINLNIIVPNNLINVAQEKFFYKLHDVDKYELQFLKDFLNSFIKEDSELKEYLNTVLCSYELTILKENILDLKQRNEFEKNYQNDFFEMHMTRNESYGKRLLSVKTLGNLRECFEMSNRFETILFLTVQFIRTKKQKQKLIKQFEETNIKIEKFWFFISYTIGNILALNTIKSRQLKASLLVNNSNVEFITSDQPVVNLEEQIDENGSAIFFKLYIAISPKVAITLDFDSLENSFVEENINEDIVIEKLNKIIISNSNMFLFSKTIETLERIKSTYN
jgi:hypothetical protein